MNTRDGVGRFVAIFLLARLCLLLLVSLLKAAKCANTALQIAAAVGGPLMSVVVSSDLAAPVSDLAASPSPPILSILHGKQINDVGPLRATPLSISSSLLRVLHAYTHR